MPTCVSASPPLIPLILPSTIELLRVTCARNPMAVASVIPGAPFATVPIKVLLSSKVFDNPLEAPMEILPPPVELLPPAFWPKTELPLPVVREPALYPKKELLLPVVLAWPARPPKKEFKLPSVLLEPAPTPKKEFNPPWLLAWPAYTPEKTFLL